MEIENDTVAKKDYLDLLDISAEVGEEEDDQLFQWVKSLHLVDEDGNTYPRITAHVREIGVDVERVLSEEVHINSFSQDTRDSFLQGTSQPIVNSLPLSPSLILFFLSLFPLHSLPILFPPTLTTLLISSSNNYQLLTDSLPLPLHSFSFPYFSLFLPLFLLSLSLSICLSFFFSYPCTTMTHYTYPSPPAMMLGDNQ